MKVASPLLLLSSLLVSVLASPGPINNGPRPSRPLPPVQSNQLRRLLLRSNLLKHADALEEQAKLSDGNRAFGTKAHNATVDYIKRKLDATGYYDTELQTFEYLFSEGTANFTAVIAGAQKNYDTEWFTYGPAGTVEAKVVIVNELGCVAVCILARIDAGGVAVLMVGCRPTSPRKSRAQSP